MVLTTKETETEEYSFSAKPVEKSYFAQVEIEPEMQEAPIFEVEKEYDNITLPERKTRSSMLPEFDIIPEKQVAPQKEKACEKQMSLSLRGKIIAAVASVVVVLLLTMVSYNAVILGSRSKEVARLSAQVQLKQSEIATLENMLKYTASETNIQKLLSENNSSLRKATDADKVKLVLSIREVEPVTAPTNWFDKLCDFLSGLF